MGKIGQRIREWALYQILTPIRMLFEARMRRRNEVLLYCVMGNGLGDALAISTILKALHEQTGVKGIVFSMHPSLFENNPMVVMNLGYRAMASWRRSLFKMLLRALRGPSVLCVGGEVWTVGSNPFDTKDLIKQRKLGWSWLEMLLPDYRPNIDFKSARPAIFFSPAEIRQYTEKYQSVGRPFAVLKATVGVHRPGGNYLKNWDVEKIAEVVGRFPEIPWLQLGDAGEEMIPGAFNLLGQTSLRESMWLVSESKFIFSVEGFLTHVANAFIIPAVTPLTAAYDPQTFIYAKTIPLLAEPMPVCAPCWKEHCEVAGMPCRSRISLDNAIVAVRQLIGQINE